MTLETLGQNKQETNGTDSTTNGLRSSMGASVLSWRWRPRAHCHAETTSNDPVIDMDFDPTFSFGSEATNLEYSMLSAILGNTVDDQLLPISSPTYPSIGHTQPPIQQPIAPYQQSGTEPWAAGVPPRPPSSVYQPPETPIDLTLISPDDVATPQPPQLHLRTSSSPQQPRPPFHAQTTSFSRSNPQQPHQEYSSLANDAPLSSTPAEPAQPHGNPAPVSHSAASRITDIYRATTRPYDYTQVIT